MCFGDHIQCVITAIHRFGPEDWDSEQQLRWAYRLFLSCTCRILLSTGWNRACSTATCSSRLFSHGRKLPSEHPLLFEHMKPRIPLVVLFLSSSNFAGCAICLPLPEAHLSWRHRLLGFFNLASNSSLLSFATEIAARAWLSASCTLCSHSWSFWASLLFHSFLRPWSTSFMIWRCRCSASLITWFAFPPV